MEKKKQQQIHTLICPSGTLQPQHGAVLMKECPEPISNSSCEVLEPGVTPDACRALIYKDVIPQTFPPPPHPWPRCLGGGLAFASLRKTQLQGQPQLRSATTFFT